MHSGHGLLRRRARPHRELTNSDFHLYQNPYSPLATLFFKPIPVITYTTFRGTLHLHLHVHREALTPTYTHNGLAQQ